MDESEYLDRQRCIHRARIGGRLHSIGDTVFIPYLGYNGTILRFSGRNYVAVIPHDKGQPVLYLCSQLEKGSGINTSIRIWLKGNRIQVNDTYRHIHLQTHIHRSRPHYGFLRYYVATDYSHPINIHFPNLSNAPVDNEHRE